MPPRLAFRASKFRNIEGKAAARDASYDQLHVTTAAVDGNAVAASVDRWAFAHQIDSGAAIQVKALSDTDKDAAALRPLLRGHQGRVNALEFSPFDARVLLSASADATVKVWKLPSDAASDALPSESAATLTGAEASITSLRHHPSAADIVGAVSARDVLVLDIAAEALAFRVPLRDDDDAFSSVAWNYDGTALITSSLNQHVHVSDPRVAESVVTTFKAHTGRRRPTSVVWCGRRDLVLTTGCDPMQERELKLWDPRNTATPVARERLDASIGPLFPLYDVDVDLVYVLGKGDRSVRTFEVDATGVHKLSQTLLPHMTLAAALVPKSACDTTSCEVARVLSLSANGGGSNGVCDVVSFTVPRKDALREFQRDLYPDTLAHAAAQSAAQWKAGENAVPLLERVTPSVANDAVNGGGYGRVFGVATAAAPTPLTSWTPSRAQPPPPPQQATEASAAGGNTTNGWGHTATASTWGSATSSAWGAGATTPEKPTNTSTGWASKTTAWNAAAPAAVPTPATAVRPVQWLTAAPASTTSAEDAAADTPAPTEQVVSEKIARFTTSQAHKLKYIKGKQSTRNEALSLGDKVPASNCIKANDKYVALPLQGAGGGPVLVYALGATGRVTQDDLVLDGHKSTVTDVAFHSFDREVLATASGDGTVALWKLDAATRATPTSVLRGHTKGVRSLEFHPRASDVLCSTAQDLSIRLWDLEAGVERVSLLGKLEDSVWNTAFSPDGSLLATSSRERVVRVFDPRAGNGHALVSMGCGFDSMRPQFVQWLSTTHLVTLGATGAPRHETQLRIWDARNLVDPLSTTPIDADAAESVPFFDASSRALLLASAGGRHIWSYEIIDHAVHANLPFVADGQQPISAATLLPKRLCDVRSAEIDRLLLLRGNTVETVSFTLPRNEKLRAYFQDDVFGGVPTETPSLSASAWFAGEAVVMEYESLCPEGMIPLSEKPEEENKPVPMSQQFRAKWEAEDREKRLKAENLERLQVLAAQPSLHGQAATATVRANDESDDEWDG